MKVLLADADPKTRERLRASLEDQGYNVLAVGDGQSALTRLSCGEGPWIALINVTLPDMDGLSVCRKLRVSAQHHSIYVILRSKPATPDDVVRCLGAGADDHLPANCNRNVLRARLRLAERALRTRHALAAHAMRDPLTGLPNRTFIIERLAECVLHAKEDPEYRFLLLLINIDRFKVVNDSLGHTSGNLAIKRIARRLVHSVRTRHAGVPVPGDERRRRPSDRVDTVARLDGDEFLVLLEQMEDMEEGVQVANRVLESLGKGFEINGEEVVLSASIGIAMSHGETTDASEILRAANKALDSAKQQGRARYEIVSPVMSDGESSPLKLETDLRHALDRGELEVHYQPIMDLAKGELRRFEALLRWRHPQRGLVPPSTFIPLAEETGLILPLGSAVLRAACQQMQEWNALFDVPTNICVNISPRQFVQTSFVSQIEEAVRDYGLDPKSLELEVTENLTVNDVTRAAQILKELVGCGVSVGLDDFGTGYSSLSYLLKLPIHTLKIDRSFVSQIEHNAESLSIVQTIIALGHNLGMKVTAEGIETQAQLKLLQELKCDYGQGYLFSPAIDATRATEMLVQSRDKTQFAAVPPAKPVQLLTETNIPWTGMPTPAVLACAASTRGFTLPV